MKWIFIVCLLIPPFETKAQSPSDSFDDLVNELSARQRRNEGVAAESPFDKIQIHGGMGLINSFSTFQIDGKNSARYQNGLQLSMGVDLFSPNWVAEVAWRNFGLTRDGSEEHSLKEFDLKLGYKDRIEGPWSYRLQSGLAQRELKLTDSMKNIRVEAATPAILASAGAILGMSANAPFISKSADERR
ncbi:MAG TPA: hypothetical protein PL182_14005, partial [Pseudobdellovibrionaceae bacterium]|nr:hypothetical protein [Pseudobdellovibrionaceae bacterium]